MFPTFPPLGASWSTLTWKLKTPTSISRLGLLRVQVDLRGGCRSVEGDVLGMGIGIIGGNRRCRNFLLRTKTATLCLDEIVSVWANICNFAIDVPSFCFVILYCYFQPDVDSRENSCLTIV